jgi:hypothetical protein
MAIQSIKAREILDSRGNPTSLFASAKTLGKIVKLGIARKNQRFLVSQKSKISVTSQTQRTGGY